MPDGTEQFSNLIKSTELLNKQAQQRSCSKAFMCQPFNFRMTFNNGNELTNQKDLHERVRGG